MHRPFAPLLALALSLSPTILPSLPPARAATTCQNPSPQTIDLEQRFSRFSNGIDQKSGAESLAEFQDLLTQVRSSSNPALRASFLEQVAIGGAPGISTIPLRSLQQALELDQSGPDRNKPQTDRFIAFTQELSKIAQSLPVGHSFTKTRSLAQLADYAILLGQPQLAPPLLQSAELAAAGVQGDVLRGLALARVARVQAIANLPNAPKNLAQAAQLYAKPPAKDRSRPLALDLGIAAATIGGEPLAQEWINVMTFGGRENGYAAPIYQALVRSALRRNQGPAALAIARRITVPLHQAESLGEISEFYARNASPVTAKTVLTQAWKKWGNTKEASAQHAVINSAALSGYFDEAIAWIKQTPADSPKPITHRLILSLAKAQQPEKAGQMLDLYLKNIQTFTDSTWQISEFSSWAIAARRARLLNWAADRWTTLPGEAMVALQRDSFATNYAKQTSIATAAAWTDTLTDRPTNSPFPSKILAVTGLADYAYAEKQPAQAQALLTKLEAQIEPYIQRLKKDGQSIGPIQSEAYARIAQVYGKAGQKAEARRLLQLAIKANPELGNPQFAQPTDNPYSLMMEAKLFDLADEAAEAMVTPETRLQWMYGKAIAQAKINQLEPARQLLKQANIAGIWRTDLLLAIAAQQKGQAAKATLQQALTAARTIGGAESEFDRLGAEGGTVIPLETDRGSVVISVAVAHARLGFVAEAKAIVAQLKDAENRKDGASLIQAALTEGGCR